MGKSDPAMLRKRSSTDTGSVAAEAAVDNAQAIRVHELLHKLNQLVDRKESSVVGTEESIRWAASAVIARVRDSEQHLLSYLSTTHRRDIANLRKAQAALKKQLGEMTSLRQRVADRRDCRVSPNSTTYAADFTHQVDAEIRQLIQSGKQILAEYSHTMDFRPCEQVPVELGALYDKDLKQIVDDARAEMKERRNTVSSVHSMRVTHLNLRKARSTNDIVRAPAMSLVFTMSNEDLLSGKASQSCEDLTANNQSLIFSITKTGTLPGHVNDPRDVAFLPNGDICLADHGNNRLQLFDKGGDLKKVMQQIVFSPNGVTMTRDGYIAVTDDVDKNIKVFTRSGDLVCKFGTGYFKNITSIKTNSKDHFVVIDNCGAWHQYVYVYNSMTGAKQRIGHCNTGAYVINQPAYVTVDTHDNVIIADSGLHCVWVFHSNGQLLRKFGQQGGGDGQLSYPTGVCCDPSGNIYVADSANHRVCMFSAEGKFVRSILNGSDGLDYPQVVNVQGSRVAVVQRSGLQCFRLI